MPYLTPLVDQKAGNNSFFFLNNSGAAALQDVLKAY